MTRGFLRASKSRQRRETTICRAAALHPLRDWEVSVNSVLIKKLIEFVAICQALIFTILKQHLRGSWYRIQLFKIIIVKQKNILKVVVYEIHLRDGSCFKSIEKFVILFSNPRSRYLNPLKLPSRRLSPNFWFPDSLNLKSLGAPNPMRDSEAKLLLWLGCVKQLLRFVVGGYSKNDASLLLQWKFNATKVPLCFWIQSMRWIQILMQFWYTLFFQIIFPKSIFAHILCSHCLLWDAFIEHFIVNLFK